MLRVFFGNLIFAIIALCCAEIILILCTKPLFTLGPDYDRILTQLNLKWVHIN